jgi:hypothetical protein
MIRIDNHSTADDERRWAEEQFGLAAYVPPAERQRRLLRHLDSAEFMPPVAWHDALEIVLQSQTEVEAGGPPDCRAFCREVEDRWRDEVDEFARSFFAIPPDVRRERWARLRDQCALSHSLAFRLKRLEPGLAIAAANFAGDSSPAGKLADWIVHLFTLTPEARARQVCVALDLVVRNAKYWRKAAARLPRVRPDIARLDPELLDGIRLLGKWPPNRKNPRLPGITGLSRPAKPIEILGVIVVLGVLGICATFSPRFRLSSFERQELERVKRMQNNGPVFPNLYLPGFRPPQIPGFQRPGRNGPTPPPVELPMDDSVSNDSLATQP